MQFIATLGVGEKMENEVENTVEDMQEDNNAIKQMRERIKELESVEKEYKSVQMANAIKDAGFDPDTGAGKALKDLYKGELQADAIKEKQKIGFSTDEYEVFNFKNTKSYQSKPTNLVLLYASYIEMPEGYVPTGPSKTIFSDINIEIVLKNGKTESSNVSW